MENQTATSLKVLSFEEFRNRILVEKGNEYWSPDSIKEAYDFYLKNPENYFKF